MSQLDEKKWHLMQRRMGRRVRVLRLARGLDQLGLASMAGYRNANVICDIEKGKYNPPLHKLWAIAAVLDTTPDALMAKTPMKRNVHGTAQGEAMLRAVASLPPGISPLIVSLALGLRKELLGLL